VDHRVYYLLLHRVALFDSIWQGVTGGVEDDEELLETAARELFEETNFTSSAIRQVPFSYSFPLSEQWRYLYAAGVETITEYVFAAPVDRQLAPVIDPREHVGWGWFGYDQALARLTWPDNIEALRRCQTLIMGKLVHA
jgi:dATP pyrophosphohydrolase